MLGPKQKKIEDSWLEIVHSQYKDLGYIEKKHSFTLVSKLKYAMENLEILTQRITFRKKFPVLVDKFNDPKLMLLSFSLALKGVFYNLSYTNICHMLGSKILFKIYLDTKNSQTMELENKELLKITKQSNSYEEFISNINYDLTHILTLGDLFLSLLIIYPRPQFIQKRLQ